MFRKFKSKNVDVIFVFGLVLLLQLIPYITKTYMDMYWLVGISLFVCMFLFISIVFGVRNNYRTISINYFDFLLCLYIVYCCVNTIILNDSVLGQHIYIKWFIFIMIYIIIRRALKSESYVFNILYISALMQSMFVIFQRVGILKSNNFFFHISGSLLNPSHSAVIISMGICAMIYYMFRYFLKSNRLNLLYVLIPLCICMYSLYLCNSRGAWLGVIMVILYNIYNRLKIKGYSKSIKLVTFIVMIIVMFGIVLFLYSYKPISANSRIFIWKISFGLICNHVLFGGGVSSFSREYLISQADFFEHNFDSRYAILANSTSVPYNEFIHLLCEQGLVGFTIILCIAYVIYNSNRNYLDKNIVLCLSIISAFTYTFNILPVFCLVSILLGTISNRIKHNFLVTLRMRVVTVPIFVSIMLWLVVFLYRYDNADRLLKKYISDAEFELNEELPSSYDIIKYNAEMSNRLHTILLNHKNTDVAYVYLCDLYKIFPTYKKQCDLGVMLKKMGRYDEAVSSLTYANYMVPCNIRANYELFKIYVQLNDYENAEKFAKLIIKQKVRIHGDTVIKIKSEVKSWLRNYNNV